MGTTKKETVTIKPESIAAEEWQSLAEAVGANVEAVGAKIRTVAAFMSRHAGLSSRDAADYMSAKPELCDGALSHATIAQHVRLYGYFETHAPEPLRTDAAIGKARSVLGFARYVWKTFDATVGMAEIAAMTEHDGERGAAFIRAIESAYSASKTTEAREAASADAEAKREAAKAERETKKAEAEAKLIGEATARAEKAEAEAEALRANVIRADGSAEAWNTFAALCLSFAESAETMTESAESALRLILEMRAEAKREAEAAKPKPESAKPESAPKPKPRSRATKPREAVAA